MSPLTTRAYTWLMVGITVVSLLLILATALASAPRSH